RRHPPWSTLFPYTTLFRSVDEGPVEAPLVLHEPVAVPLREHGVAPRHGHVVEEDAAVRRAPDRRALALGRERLARAAAARADDRSEEHTSELQSLAYLVCR